MTKLDKDLYIKHAKRMEAILNDKSTFVTYLTRPDFDATIRNELNVLHACEKLFPKVKLEKKYSAKNLAESFSKLAKTSFTLNEEYHYDEEVDLIDSINYLYTFCNNMFKVNLDDLVAGKNVTATDPKIDLRVKPDFSDEGPKMNRNFAFAAGGIPLASTPYENPYLIGKAYAKLNDDIKAGRFYRFKTQPKIIPIMKWISTILMMILLLGFVLSAVFAFLSANVEVSIETQTGLGIPGCVGSGIIYAIMAVFCVYPIVMTMKTLVGKGGRNPNERYHFAWGFVVTLLVLSFLILMLDIRSTWLPFFDVISTSGTAYNAWQAWKIMFILCCAIIGLNIVPIIFGSIYNPKPDPEIVEKKIREYIDMFSAESGQSPVPPKADVQKPADVKDTKKHKK